ncbi:hypothetical protein L7F22_014802 [Adiantum nelumboides]|nr:hypothetical protein [Adiantum nelumboides]
MATKGFAVVARRLPRLCSVLRPSVPLPPLPQTHVIAPPHCSLANASSIFGLQLQGAVSTFGCHLHFSTSPSSQVSLRTFDQIICFCSNRMTAVFMDCRDKEVKPPAASSNEGEKTLSFRNIMISFATAPMVPMFLGVSGALPFLALTPPFPYWLLLPEVIVANPIEAQALYGAVILSFLGAPHWGLAMVGIHASPSHKIFNFASNSVRYVWSVIPSLLAWPALLMSTVPKLQILICSFALVLGVDVIFASSGLLPPWYLSLRVLLTGVVILCLSASLLELLIIQKLEKQKTKSVGSRATQEGGEPLKPEKGGMEEEGEDEEKTDEDDDEGWDDDDEDNFPSFSGAGRPGIDGERYQRLLHRMRHSNGATHSALERLDAKCPQVHHPCAG